MQNFPDTSEKRQAGMAAVRARMLAAHERQIASGKLKGVALQNQQQAVAVLKATQVRLGEVA
jgi:hypothetical protein